MSIKHTFMNTLSSIQALTLIEFLLKNGSERVIEACRDKIYKIRSLENFNFYEGTLDRGSGVREKSKQIVELLGSNEMIRTEREKASSLRDKFVGIGNDGSRGSTGSTSTGSHYSGSGGGGGSYGNGGDRGFGNSYSGNQHSSNGGGQDSYSSNSNGRESRYTNDSYDSSRGGGTTSGSGSNGRYRDDDYKNTTEAVAPTRRSNDDEEDEVRIKPKAKASSKLSAPTSDTAVGGKLKLSIKKGSTTAAPSAVPAQPAAMLDFMDSGDSDFVSAPAPTVPSTFSNPNVFDAFTTPASSAQDDFGFASFDAAPVQQPQQQQQSQAFDPFGMGSPPPLPQSQPVMQFSQPTYQQPPAVAQQSFVSFDTPVQNFPAPQPPVNQNIMHQTMQQPASSQQSFGQFNSSAQTSPMSPMMQTAPQQHQFQQPMGYNSPATFQSPPVQQQQQQMQPQMQQQQQPQQQIFRGIVPKTPEPVLAPTDNLNPAGTQVREPIYNTAYSPLLSSLCSSFNHFTTELCR